MFYLVELYSPKSSWLALSYDERLDFFQKVQVKRMGLPDGQIEMVAMGAVDARKLRSASQQFFAIWSMPEESSLDALIEVVRGVGWYDYFDTVNAAGRGGGLPAHLQELALLS